MYFTKYVSLSLKKKVSLFKIERVNITSDQKQVYKSLKKNKVYKPKIIFVKIYKPKLNTPYHFFVFCQMDKFHYRFKNL